MQRTLRFESFEPGAVNRAYKVRVTASGKVVNSARVVTVLGGQALLATFLGGDPGRFVARELDARGVPHEVVWTEDDAPTRTCATLISDGGPVTELVEEALPVSEGDVAALEEFVTKNLKEAQALCLIGSFPPGVPDDFYARLTAAAREAGVRVLVDAQKAPLRAALEEGPFLVKPNLEEVAATLDLPDGELDARAAVAALTDAGARWALVSTGVSGSLLGEDSGALWRVEPPRVEAINPIGSGDSMAAGILLSLQRGASVPDAAVYGTACAAANALTPTSGEVRPDDVDGMLSRVRLTQIV
ncbi:MAG: 1-phosphofructokinase [uncultured Rubrobacteraceae bacterium]|uniref:1-phosphofructokinase n=1 Tax=uncultured Rubrobacteraceae bacterium TaxID=349277 RepID=A0A6J4Q146_9ACTN|nr:MAG: 1-phosphofructokinase [uncultured Rubrobacteraceae bacterium]